MNIYCEPNIPRVGWVVCCFKYRNICIHIILNINSPFSAIRNLQLHQQILIILCSLDNRLNNETIYPIFENIVKIRYALFGDFIWQIYLAGDRRDVSNNKIIGRRQYWRQTGWDVSGSGSGTCWDQAMNWHWPWAARSQCTQCTVHDQRTQGLHGSNIWPIKMVKKCSFHDFYKTCVYENQSEFCCFSICLLGPSNMLHLNCLIFNG